MRQRFYAKRVLVGTRQQWRIYDSERGSFPYRTPELGVVTQDHATEKAADAEAARLQQLLGDPTSRRAHAAPAARRDKRRTNELVEADDANQDDLTDTASSEPVSEPASRTRRKTRQSAKPAQPQGRASQLDSTPPPPESTAVPSGGRKLGTAQQALWDALLAAGDAGLTATEAAAICGVAATNAATALRKFTERGWASGDGARPQRFTADPDAGP